MPELPDLLYIQGRLEAEVVGRTVVGARQEPRTLLTKTAILLCLVIVFALLVIIGSV